MQLHIVTYEPLSGSSYIPTPLEIQKSKAVLNIQNDDNKCIVWSILAHLHPAKYNKCEVYSYRRYEAEINVAGFFSNTS